MEVDYHLPRDPPQLTGAPDRPPLRKSLYDDEGEKKKTTRKKGDEYSRGPSSKFSGGNFAPLILKKKFPCKGEARVFGSGNVRGASSLPVRNGGKDVGVGVMLRELSGESIAFGERGSWGGVGGGSKRK